MFRLTDVELQNAYEAINHHGYSTMLPQPHEWKFIVTQWAAVKDSLTRIDLDIYKPYNPLQVFAPKSRANIRLIHLLHPEDLLIYTALTLIIKNDIESARISRRYGRIFSYRVDKSACNRLYDASGAYDAYLKQLTLKAGKDDVQFVGLADIADFFPRIYQHRLENVIQANASSDRGRDVARVLVGKLISNLMGRNSYGIPVGPYASRILGEAILIDVDSFLQSNKLDYVRWVDDYNIFCRTEFLAQSALFGLGEWLFSNHGLTLQSSKTKIMPVYQFRDEVVSIPEDRLTDRDHVLTLLRKTPLRDDYDDDLLEEESDVDGWEEENDEVFLEEGPNEEDVQTTLEEFRGYDLHQMFVKAISNQALVDYEMVKYVLTRLPKISGANDALKLNILDLVLDNAQVLYPAAEFIAEYVLSFADLSDVQKRKISRKLLKPLKNRHHKSPDYYAMWILHIFSTSEQWNQVNDIIDLYQRSTSEVVKRYAALAISVCGSRAEALVVKQNFSIASDLHRLAVLAATKKLGKDERHHWKQANQIKGITEKIL